MPEVTHHILIIPRELLHPFVAVVIVFASTLGSGRRPRIAESVIVAAAGWTGVTARCMCIHCISRTTVAAAEGVTESSNDSYGCRGVDVDGDHERVGG
jgi:hypothetical protein